MHATFKAMIYEMGFILTAGKPYVYTKSSITATSDCGYESDSDGDIDMNVHITNLSVNKRIDGHPGQVPVNIRNEYPEVLYCTAWYNTVRYLYGYNS